MILETVDAKVASQDIVFKGGKEGAFTAIVDGREVSQDIKFRGEGNAAMFYDEETGNIIPVELNGLTKSMRFIGVVRGD